MTCQEFWKRLSRPPGVETDPGPEHRAHMAGCPACAARLARQREITAGLRLVAEGLSGLKAPARVEDRLVRAFRARHGGTAAVERKPWLAGFAWAMATLLLAAALAAIDRGQPPSPRAGPVAETAAEAYAVAAPSLSAAEAAPDGFIPLPNAERIEPNDDTNLVRVEMPRSALMALGITVSSEGISERVEADVLLGPDGVARAVRLLD